MAKNSKEKKELEAVVADLVTEKVTERLAHTGYSVSPAQMDVLLREEMTFALKLFKRIVDHLRSTLGDPGGDGT